MEMDSIKSRSNVTSDHEFSKIEYVKCFQRVIINIKSGEKQYDVILNQCLFPALLQGVCFVILIPTVLLMLPYLNCHSCSKQKLTSPRFILLFLISVETILLILQYFWYSYMSYTFGSAFSRCSALI